MRKIVTVAAGVIAMAFITGKSFAYSADYCSHHPKEAQCQPHHHHHHHPPQYVHHEEPNQDHHDDHSDINHNVNDDGQHHPE